jgi:hypothetical protein
VNRENQCLYYVNFIIRILSLQRRLYRLSQRAAAEYTNPTSKRSVAMLASRRSLHHRSPSHLHLLSSVTSRVSRLMVATQQVKGKHTNIYASSNKLGVIAKSILQVRFIYISNLFTMWDDFKFPTQKLVHYRGWDRGLPRKPHDPSGCLTTLPKTIGTHPTGCLATLTKNKGTHPKPDQQTIPNLNQHNLI